MGHRDDSYDEESNLHPRFGHFEVIVEKVHEDRKFNETNQFYQFHNLN